MFSAGMLCIELHAFIFSALDGDSFKFNFVSLIYFVSLKSFFFQLHLTKLQIKIISFDFDFDFYLYHSNIFFLGIITAENTILTFIFS